MSIIAIKACRNRCFACIIDMYISFPIYVSYIRIRRGILNRSTFYGWSQCGGIAYRGSQYIIQLIGLVGRVLEGEGGLRSYV